MMATPTMPAPLFDYRSKCVLLGLPLVHIRLRGGLESGAVKAWIAGGDAAVGVIFAFGAVAVAPPSLGGLAAGLFTFGGGAIALCGALAVAHDFAIGPAALAQPANDPVAAAFIRDNPFFRNAVVLTRQAQWLKSALLNKWLKTWEIYLSARWRLPRTRKTPPSGV